MVRQLPTIINAEGLKMLSVLECITCRRARCLRFLNYRRGDVFAVLSNMYNNFSSHQVFRPTAGIWMDANGRVLADVLAEHGLTIDERTQFARLYDYDEMKCFWYRAYGAFKITLTIYPISDKR